MLVKNLKRIEIKCMIIACFMAHTAHSKMNLGKAACGHALDTKRMLNCDCTIASDTRRAFNTLHETEAQLYRSI